MTHAEFIADIQRARSFVDDRNSTMVLSLAAVDHLLAIHAAVVEMLDARHGFLSDDGVVTVSGDQLTAAFDNLAALCGWTGEEGA